MGELAIFKNLKMPSRIQELGLDEVTKTLMGSGISTKRISIKGGVWRLMAGDETLAEKEERTLNVVILAASKVGRVYYGQAYEEGVSLSPVCWSADGETPDMSVEEPQSDKCATCPHNIKGSGPNGTKACRFLQRIAVVLEGDLGGEIYQLQLPATSIFGDGEGTKLPLHKYAQMLGARKVPITAVVTEMRFDTAAAVPKVIFKPVRILEDDEIDTILEQVNSADAEQASKIEFSTLHNSGDSDGDDEPFEQEAPKKPAKKAAAKKPTVKPRAKPTPEPEAEDEDEVEDEDDLDIDEAEDEVVEESPKKVKRTAKKKPVVDEDDDDDDSDNNSKLLSVLDEWDD